MQQIWDIMCINIAILSPTVKILQKKFREIFLQFELFTLPKSRAFIVTKLFAWVGYTTSV